MSGLFYPEFFLHYLLTPTLQCLVSADKWDTQNVPDSFFLRGPKKLRWRETRALQTHTSTSTHTSSHTEHKSCFKRRWNYAGFLSFSVCLCPHLSSIRAFSPSLFSSLLSSVLLRPQQNFFSFWRLTFSSALSDGLSSKQAIFSLLSSSIFGLSVMILSSPAGLNIYVY